jgi:hypothetical protein
MHIACMATKTISLKVEAWERLRRARRSPTESYSEVVMRAQWPEMGITGGELLGVYLSEGPHFTAEALDRMSDLDADSGPETAVGRPEA